MYLKLVSDDNSLSIRIKSLAPAEQRDAEGFVTGVTIVGNDEHALFAMVNLQLRPLTLDEAKKNLEQASKLLAKYEAEAKAKADSETKAPATPTEASAA